MKLTSLIEVQGLGQAVRTTRLGILNTYSSHIATCLQLLFHQTKPRHGEDGFSNLQPSTFERNEGWRERMARTM